MPPKCVETIDCLPYEGKEIVHPSRKLEDKVHHRYGHRVRNSPKSATSNCSSFDPDRGRDEHRQGLIPPVPEENREGIQSIHYPVSPSLLFTETV